MNRSFVLGNSSSSQLVLIRIFMLLNSEFYSFAAYAVLADLFFFFAQVFNFCVYFRLLEELGDGIKIFIHFLKAAVST